MKLRIGSIVENSLIDVLFHPAFVIFCSGCNLRCPWCQNGGLVKNQGSEVEIDEILELVKRNFLIEYVQASGGEPCLQANGIEELFEKVKSIGLKTSLNTNACFPRVIEKFLNKGLLDHIALDVKFPLTSKKDYSKVVGVDSFQVREKVLESLELIKDFGFVEVRTTLVPGLLSPKDVIEIVKELARISKNFYYVLQQFSPEGDLLDPEFKKLERTDPRLLTSLGKKIKKKFKLRVFLRTKEKGVVGFE